MPYLAQIIPYAGTLALLYVLPIALARPFAILEYLRHGVHGIDLGQFDAVLTLFGQSTSTYAIYDPCIREISLICMILAFELHAVGVKVKKIL
jgi:hypothetical protein